METKSQMSTIDAKSEETKGDESQYDEGSDSERERSVSRSRSRGRSRERSMSRSQSKSPRPREVKSNKSRSPSPDIEEGELDYPIESVVVYPNYDVEGYVYPPFNDPDLAGEYQDNLNVMAEQVRRSSRRSHKKRQRSRSISRSRSRSRRRSRKRNRSKSPIQHRRGDRNDYRRNRRPRYHDKPPLFHIDKTGSRGCEKKTVVILRTSVAIAEKRWRRTIMDSGYTVYDHTYPYRLAARIILREDRKGTRPRQTPMPVENFAQFLCGQTSSFFGHKYIVDYFLDWFRKQRSNKVVICGLANDKASGFAINGLRDMGAVIVSEPGILGDFTVSNEKDISRVFSQIHTEFRM
jgi:hypothetical protein